MRSMVEGHSEAVSPSTAFHAVPLPIAFGDRKGNYPSRSTTSAFKSASGRAP